MMIPVPWNEQAVLVHHVAVPTRRMSGEGAPSQMMDRAAGIPVAEQARYPIFRPDRRMTPFHFGPEDSTVP